MKTTQFRLRYIILLALGLGLISCGGGDGPTTRNQRQVLLYSPSYGALDSLYKSIASGADFTVDTTGSLEGFDEEGLKKYSALMLTGVPSDSISLYHQSAIERYVQAGGGLLAFNNPPSQPYDWPWYNSLDSLARSGMSNESFSRLEFDGGRAVLASKLSLIPGSGIKDSLIAVVDYAIGDNKYNYSLAKSSMAPQFFKFSKIVLDDDTNEPMEMDILPDGKVVYIERRGRMKLYLPQKDTTIIISEFEVCTEGNYEDGLLGLSLDPGYGVDNHWLYLYYSPPCDNPNQLLSRFEFKDDVLDRGSEIVMLEVKVQRETCCHSGGSVEFGPDGMLYLSTGDNTSSKESNGYTPIDERPGRGPFDAQKSSGNMNDLRGKILRIIPNEDGTYDIPEGNLFAADGSEGRPEIYVMGARNPFRITIDPRTNYLYWGDVGPDSGSDSRYGPQSYDEWNQARSAGNYGWPYFEADNKAFPDRDFANDTTGDLFDPEHPVNTSPNNTGKQNLPPARPAMIWYPYGPSKEFPQLGQGSRSAMAGPFYYDRPEYRKFVKFPEYYAGKMFIFEWARSWIKVLTFDDDGKPIRIEPFMPETDWVKPIDMKFGPDGALYVLEYGNQYFMDNPEAKLARIEYSSLNKAPQAHLMADVTRGGSPLTVNFSAEESFDFDRNDSLSYTWYFTDSGEAEAEGKEASFTFNEPGEYSARVVVRDDLDATDQASLTILVGNEPPTVKVEWPGNQSFYFPNTGALPYKVVATDPEDGGEGGIDPENISFSMSYVNDNEFVLDVLRGKKTLPEGPVSQLEGMRLIAESDCRTCHDEKKVSVGPTYEAIAVKYKDRYDAVAYLAEKVIKGGNGNWGEAMMAAHPQHNETEASEMVAYILSLNEATTLPAEGTMELNKHAGEDKAGNYLMSAAYTDKGANGIRPLRTRSVFALRPPTVEAEDCDVCERIFENRFGPGLVETLITIGEGGYLGYQNLDLGGIRNINLLLKPMRGGVISARRGSPDGKEVGSLKIPTGSTSADWKSYRLPIKAEPGKADLYLMFTNEEGGPVSQIDKFTVER